MKITIDQIKKLREETGAAVMDCRQALDKSGGDVKKAKVWLEKRGREKAEKKAGRQTGEGLIEAYIHATGKVGAIVEVTCETDFVARNAEFKNLAHEIAMQVASMNPRDLASLLKQEYIRDNSKTVEELIKETIGKLGENIVVKRIQRFEI
ncbi:MAG: translation elongation factor Ts [bacterium]|nr:translation elongation factor Ts [bacterium]